MFRLGLSWKVPAALFGMGAVGFVLGTWSSHPSDAAAQTPQGPTLAATTVAPKSDYSQRVVAYIYGTEPVTREDLGEFLIARQGEQYVDPLVNRRIIERACKDKNITIADADVEASLNEDLASMHIDRATFVKQFLKQYHKTLFEWKEDVIRPRLMLTKLCGTTIHVDEADVKKAFDSKFGEKVQCRIIVWQESEFRRVQQLWDKLRTSEAEFATAARSQYMPALASLGGKIDPVCHGVADNDLVEKVAFRLQPNEVSEIINIPGQGIAVLKCDGRIPPVPGATYENEYKPLYKQAFDLKVTKAIPDLFKKLKEEAHPNVILKHGTENPTVVQTHEEEQRLEKQDVPLPDRNK